ncbi:ferritin-like domain-containing protein [Silanimonas sp.]|uniref:ferritin-like domain-containing protein n=1 Tax=Silanimonas sp. TaxID=1929290 RepID=UPI0022BDE12C|nr:ferritin-like domain-containing protein [Silanimonas sp.]MCZ8063846.1 ferritin-like domain-containing protein [Silanimonas sp.]
MGQGIATGLYAAAADCLATADPQAKCAKTRAYAAAFFAGALPPEPDAPPPEAIHFPGRPERPRLVHPKHLPKRGLGSIAGRAAFLHAIAHIELNAVDLAWDAVYRFREFPADIGAEFAADFVRTADDEARHFQLLAARLAELGHAYGDFDAHNGLWEMAEKTADSALARMALVPRVLEARGLDVTPGLIERLRDVGDAESIAVLEVILREEVAHVAAGSRWFRWLCERDGLKPWPTFAGLVRAHASRAVQGPFNWEARRRAGFDDEEIAAIERGELAPGCWP